MILADKIINLRKKAGWSQEELAQQLDISRQSVSKWESGASIPDLDKIIKMSSLFGVSTDYLLKDELETVTFSESDDNETEVKSISVEEANRFMSEGALFGKRLAPAVALCITSPIAVILLAGMAEYGKIGMSEDIAGVIGVIILLAMIACAVAIMIISGMRMNPYEYIGKEDISLQYGVQGIVQKKKSDYAKTFGVGLAVGVALCILGVVPLLICGALELEFACIVATCVLLALIACGVFIIIRVSMVHDCFDKLLEEGDYTVQKKWVEREFERRMSFVPGVYWCLVVALYLGISIPNDSWDTSWFVWPVAAVLFAALVGGIKAYLAKGYEK